jgi:hypothetical protein
MVEWIAQLAASLGRLPPFSVAARHVEPRLLLLYLEEALYLQLLEAGRQIFRARLALRSGGETSPVAIPADLLDVVRSSLPDSGLKFVPAAPRFLRAQVLRWRRLLRDAVFSRRRSKPAARASAGMVAVELAEGADPHGKSDAFWLAGGLVDPGSVLFVLESGNRALIDLAGNIEAIRRLGSHAVALDPRMTLGGAIPFWKPRALPDWTSEVQDSLPRERGGAGRWLAQALAELAQHAGFWEAFFLDHGVLVVQQFTEISTATAVKRIAIDRVGGIEIGKMRSELFESASAAFHFQHEVAFVWHAKTRDALSVSKTRTDVLIETGYVYDYLQTTYAADARELRRRLRTAGGSIVIAAFDNDSHINGNMSDAHLESFYDAILGLAARHPEIGLVIKSKKPTVLRRIPRIHEAVRALVDLGRCIVIDRPLSSVAPAALAADIALGVPASTAACEAALFGCRTLAYDPARAAAHPWCAPGAQILFDGIDEFSAACERAIDDVRDGRRGMPRERLLELDPHLDGKAAVRAASFISSFVEARKRGQNKRTALSIAIDHCAGYATAGRTNPH